MRSSVEMLTALNQSQNKAISPLRLTPRGAEVFALILNGVNDVSIGQRLGISYSAVRRHREKMLLQNSCDTMLELIAKHNSRWQDDESRGK